MTNLPLLDGAIVEAELDDRGEQRLVAHGPAAVDASTRVNLVLSAMADLKAIRTFIAQELQEGIDKDFAMIPGTTKKNLLQPGAQKVCSFLNVYPQYELQSREIGDPAAGHVEWTVTCRLFSRASGQQVGEGVGSCTSMESRYRYRGGEVELTDMPVPKSYWVDRDPAVLGGKNHVAKKDENGRWVIGIKTGEKVENPNVWDVRNTVLKIAKKRSFVDATITMANLSEFFTQDLEDLDIFELRTETKTDAGSAHAPSASAPEPEPRADLDRGNDSSLTTPSSKATRAPASGSKAQTATILPASCTAADKRWLRDKKKEGDPEAARCGYVYDSNKTKWSITGGPRTWTLVEAAIRGQAKVTVTYRVNGDYRNVEKIEEAL